MKTIKSLCYCCTLFLLSQSVMAQDVHVAVASNFTQAMKKIAQGFEQSTGDKVITSFASSGQLYAQIQHDAPYDVFLSADQAKPLALEQSNLSVKGMRFTYAEGYLALWSPKRDDIKDKGIEALKTGVFQHLAIANPKLAPYGRAAVEALKNMKLYTKLSPRLVIGENISQTYQFVASGQAEFGFVALSQVILDPKFSKGSIWRVSDKYYTPIKQDAVLLKHGEHNKAATSFMHYLQSEPAKQTIAAYGYQP